MLPNKAIVTVFLLPFQSCHRRLLTEDIYAAPLIHMWQLVS